MIICAGNLWFRWCFWLMAYGLAEKADNGEGILLVLNFSKILLATHTGVGAFQFGNVWLLVSWSHFAHTLFPKSKHKGYKTPLSADQSKTKCSRKKVTYNNSVKIIALQQTNSTQTSTFFAAHFDTHKGNIEIWAWTSTENGNTSRFEARSKSFK